MASYHCSIKPPLSRGKGKSLMAKAAYNARTEYRDERTGEKTTDYAYKGGLVESFVTFDPKSKAPEWMKAEPERMLNAAVAAENRKDAREGQEIVLGFIDELGLQKNKWMLNDFLREQFTRGTGRVAFVNIHEPSETGDQRNYHAHVLLMLREAGPDGFGKRLAALEPEDYNHIREKWAEKGAKELEKAGFKLEADRYRCGHLLLEQQRQAALERGDLAHAETLNREATKHRGPAADAMERKGQQTERGNIHRDSYEQETDIAALKLAREQITKAIAEAERKPEIRIWEALHHNDNAPAFHAALAGQGMALAIATKAEAERSRTGAAQGISAPVYREQEIVAVDERGSVHRLTEETTGANFRDIQRYLRTLERSTWKSIDDTRQTIESRQPVETSPALHFEDAARGATGQEAAATMPANLRGTAAHIWTAYNLRAVEQRWDDKRPDGATDQRTRTVELKQRDPYKVAAALEAKGIELATVTKDEAEHSRKEAEHWRAHGEKRPTYREGEIVAVNRRGDVYQFTRRNTGAAPEDAQRFFNKADWKNLNSIEVTKGSVQARATVQDNARQKVSDKFAAARLERASNPGRGRMGRKAPSNDNAPAAFLKRGGRKAIGVAGAILAKVADILGDLLGGPPVPKTRAQIKEENRLHDLAAAQGEREIARADYDATHEATTTKRQEAARLENTAAEQYERLNRDRERGGRER